MLAQLSLPLSSQCLEDWGYCNVSVKIALDTGHARATTTPPSYERGSLDVTHSRVT